MICLVVSNQVVFFLDVVHCAEKNMLSDDTCAVCLESQSCFAATRCSKPLRRTGHEPNVCWACMQRHVEKKQTCPLCRAHVTELHKYSRCTLQASTSELSLPVAEQVVVVTSQHNVVRFPLRLQMPQSTLNRQNMCLGVCMYCLIPVMYEPNMRHAAPNCSNAIHDLFDLFTSWVPFHVSFGLTETVRHTGVYTGAMLMSLLHESDMLSAHVTRGDSLFVSVHVGISVA